MTVESFAIFARGKPPNVKLCLHMGTTDLGWPLHILARRFGISDRLILTWQHQEVPTLSTSHLNLIFNACDVGINTACAEGWGLVSFEHAATGAAQIVPGLTSQHEIWKGAPQFLEPRFVVTRERSLMNEYYISPEETACVLNDLYYDRTKLHEIGLRCHVRATSNELSWSAITNRWRAVLSQALTDNSS